LQRKKCIPWNEIYFNTRFLNCWRISSLNMPPVRICEQDFVSIWSSCSNKQRVEIFSIPVIMIASFIIAPSCHAWMTSFGKDRNSEISILLQCLPWNAKTGWNTFSETFKIIANVAFFTFFAYFIRVQESIVSKRKQEIDSDFTTRQHETNWRCFTLEHLVIAENLQFYTPFWWASEP